MPKYNPFQGGVPEVSRNQLYRSDRDTLIEQSVTLIEQSVQTYRSSVANYEIVNKKLCELYQ